MWDQGSSVGLWCKITSLCVHCTAVTTYAALVVPKLIRTFWPPVTLKSRSNPTLLYIHVRCTHDANLVTAGLQVAEILHISISVIAYKPTKVGQGDLLFVCDQGSLVQDYKCLCTAVTICTTPVVPKCILSIVTSLTPKSRSNPRHLLHPCQMHPWCKFDDCMSASCRDNADIRVSMMT